MTGTTALLHITDMHFSHSTAVTLIERASAMSEAVRGYGFGAKRCVVLITGDVAFAGKVEEYEAARRFLDALKYQLSTRGIEHVVEVVAPGNHDCDFGWEHASARAEILTSVHGGTRQIEFCLGVQSSYRAFANSIGSSRTKHDLITEVSIPWIAGLKVWSINSAWCSLLPETCGAMTMPDSLFDVQPDPQDTIIALMHHPVGWFEPETQRKLQRWLAGHCHFVLFGHEHEGDTYQAIGFGAKHHVLYRLGQCFGPHKKFERSGFTLYALDEVDFTLVETPFNLVGESYLPDESKIDATLSLRRPLRPVDLWFSRHFYEEFLNDVGCTLRHPRRNTQVALEDIFIFPQLRRRDWRAGLADDSIGRVSRADILEELLQAPLSLVFGSESSGLTTLAKVCAVSLADASNRVVYIPADKVNLAHKSQAQTALERLIRDQTKVTYAEFFSSAQRGSAVAIVDGFDAVPNDAKSHVLAALQSRFDNVVVFARDVMEVESLVHDRALAGLLGAARAWTLMPIGLELRGELIRKWLTIGATPDDSAEVFRANCTFARRIVDQLMGRFMMPKVPLSVLLILQQLEALRDNGNVITDGSQGFFVQSIAADALRSSLKCIKADAAFSFLALVAREVRQVGHGSLEKREIRRVHLSYQQLFLHEAPLEKLLAEIENAGILRTRADENGETVYLAFRYDYWYHFFLARQIVFGNDQWSNELFIELVRSVHTEESSSTLSFIAHFSADTRVLDALVALANSLYAESQECDLAMYSAHLSDLHRSLPKLELEDGDQHELEAKRDREKDADRFSRGDYYGDEVVDDPTEMNRAFKAVQVMGQILRASSGSISGNHKLRLIETSIGLVRRLLGATLNEIHENFPVLVANATSSFVEQGLDKVRAEKAAKTLVGTMLVGAVVVGVERVSSALGARDLNLVYNRYAQMHKDKTSRLLLLAMKMEYFTAMPEAELDDFLRGLKAQEVIPKRILQLTLLKRLYLFPHSHQDKRKYCAKLGISHHVAPVPPQLTLFGQSKGR